MIILISLATFLATLLGGLFALKLRDKLHLILGFSAGAVIAVAFFDLIPESLELGDKFYSHSTVLSVVAVGFLIYLIIDRLLGFGRHTAEFHTEQGHEGHDHGPDDTVIASQGNRNTLGAVSLCIHSLLDGVAIGLAFQVSTAIGAIVAVAVLTHDFSDGINTVGLILKRSGTSTKSAFRWLVADALAPVIGTVSTLFFTVPEQSLSIILALFAGFFLYIGASDLIPESYHAHPKVWTTVMTIVGVAVLYGTIKLAGV